MRSLAYFEFCMWVGVLPGALGLFVRKLFWPRLFASCGSGVLFGSGIVLRHPHRIQLGDRCVLSDGCVLEARCSDEIGLTIGPDSILSNNAMVSCKNGVISIGSRAGIGAFTVIHAVNGASVTIGDDVLVGPRCYFAGGGNYHTERTDIPMAKQGLIEETGLRLGSDIWLGAGVSVMSGVEIDDGCIIAAGAVVTKSLEKYSVAMGVPAKVLKKRGEGSE
jgi:galactoside O-acetyltransferase